MPVFPASHLEAICCRILEAAGTPAAISGRVSRILVNSNLAGHDSHGILRIPQYLRDIEAGRLVPDAVPVVLCETAATALVDCRRGWGHYAAEWAMDVALRKAAEAGCCTVVLRGCNHIGRLGEYVERAAAEGFIGSVSVGNGGPDTGCASPLGGRGRCLGTNPVAFGVPTGDGKPIVIDFATTVVAEGKIQVARSKGTELPKGCIVDREGSPSTDPAAFYDDGSLLFAGGHKGYGLSLYTCLLGALNGSISPASWGIHGTVVQALDPRAFVPIEEYQAAVRGFLHGLRGYAREGGEVLYPGEPEQRARAERLARGVDVPDIIWSQVLAEVSQLGIDAAD